MNTVAQSEVGVKCLLEKFWMEVVMGKLVSAKEVAEVLSLDQNTVRKLAKSGSIPSYRVGPRLFRFSIEAVHAALKPTPVTARSVA
jgi:excisionase family DNA binding protein